jgi:hypothetical protein
MVRSYRLYDSRIQDIEQSAGWFVYSSSGLSAGKAPCEFQAYEGFSTSNTAR